jgi:hypothetical protein
MIFHVLETLEIPPEFHSGNSLEREYLHELGKEGRMILKWMLRNCNLKMWSEII